jgi:hypothetical protein
MLVVPHQLPGVGIQRDRGVAVKIGRRRKRIGTASYLPPCRSARVFGVGLATPQYNSRRDGSNPPGSPQVLAARVASGAPAHVSPPGSFDPAAV